MIISIDTETQGLDTHKFLMGCICFENEKTEVYRDKHRLWQRIIEIGEAQRRRGESLFIYAHNMQYDYYTISYKEDARRFYTYSTNPYIVDAQNERGQIYMKFLSTTSLFRGTLEEMGKTLGYEKKETPEWCKQDEYNPNWWELKELETYMIRDTIIVMKYIKQLKKRLNENGMRPRWIITASQIGINYMLKQMKKQPNAEDFFYDTQEGKLWYTKNIDKVTEAVRGGRVEAFITGEKRDCTQIDINSHYPWCISTMRCPNLRTQIYHEKPLERGFKTEELLRYIGITKCSIKVKQGKCGVLPIRIDEMETIYPNEEQELIGTWTHRELKAAVDRGYKINHIFWTITWEDTQNPFKEAIDNLYKMKSESKDEMDIHFAKMLLNGSIGKFSQDRIEYEFTWDNIENDLTRRKEGWEAVEAINTDRLYRLEKGKNYPRYYAPVINAMVTAEARIRLLELMEQIPEDKLYYVDTDGIIADTSAVRNAKFKYGKALGDIKVVNEGVTLYSYGKKTHKIGEEIKVSGIGRIWINKDNFRTGHVFYKKMITEKDTKDKELIGTFKKEFRDLNETLQKTEEQRFLRQREKVFIDSKTELAEIVQWKMQ